MTDSSAGSPPAVASPPTLDLFFAALGVDPQEPLRDLVRAARSLRGHLAPLVLSVAARQGVVVGSGSADELRRMQVRVEDYRELAALLAADVPGVRVLKGPSLEQRYPEDVLRPSGDLDAYVPNEAALWRAVTTVLRNRPVGDVDVTVLGSGAHVHWVVVLRWPAQDPILDADHRVELVTFAYPGEPGVVPVRAEPPRDQVVCDLLAIAEEAFQRPFSVKDVLDLALTLDSPGCPPPKALAEAADRYRLAPELLRLSEMLHGCRALPSAANDRLRELLREPAGRETEARRDGEAGSGEPERAWTREPCLNSGRPLHGLRLPGEPTPGPESGVRFHAFADGVLLLCPVGVFLMVETELVSPAAHESALAELRRLRALDGARP
ncbi:hypothetical protein [Streptomyces sp. NBC_00199]|uniref:hypothetical protein n=1 Tax=Streptomyces sp. NBC_00199 TaxID=2975678 RepID=UPI00225A5EAC|nr:hypothetical protein [Streptomyces sp. NBC_00199]MCX5269492.1 nucleotidyltransferase family protein [Streptomyces sp. NBC_00199]